MCVCDSVCVGGLSAAAVQWLRVSPVWEVPKSYTTRRRAWADSVSERVCVCQRGCQRDTGSVYVSVRVRFRESECVCDSVSIREPLCCGSAVATGVARMGGAKALLGSARGVGRDSMCGCQRGRQRASVCVSESVCQRHTESVCVSARVRLSSGGGCVCVRKRVRERVPESVCVHVRGLYAAAVQWLRVSPVWEVPKPCSAQQGVCVCACVCVCQRGCQRDTCVCACQSVCVSERVS